MLNVGVTLLLSFSLYTVHSLPIPNAFSGSDKELVAIFERLEDYLTQYNYLAGWSLLRYDKAYYRRMLQDETVLMSILNISSNLLYQNELVSKRPQVPDDWRLEKLLNKIKRLMKRQRCGLPEYVPAQRLQNQKILYYRLDNVTYNSAGSADSLERIRNSVKLAFRFWMDNSPFKIEELSPTAPNTTIAIQMVRSFHGDPYTFDVENSPEHVAHVVVDYSRSVDFPEYRIHLRSDIRWEMPENQAKLQLVLKHQIGHVLGLSHPSNVTKPNSVMFPWFYLRENSSSERMLTEHEKSWMRKTYPSHSLRRKATHNDRQSFNEQYRREYHLGLQPQPIDAPHLCWTDLDVVTTIGSEFFLFKNQWFWRLEYAENGAYRIKHGYPRLLNEFWYQLPPLLSNVDAVFEVRHGRTRPILIFSGDKLYVHRGNLLENENSRSLSSIGLPSHVEKVDFLFRWPFTDEVYLVSDSMVWHFNETALKVTGPADFNKADTPKEAIVPLADLFVVYPELQRPVIGSFLDGNNSLFFVTGGRSPKIMSFQGLQVIGEGDLYKLFENCHVKPAPLVSGASTWRFPYDSYWRTFYPSFGLVLAMSLLLYYETEFEHFLK